MQRNEKTKALRAQISKLVEEYAAIAKSFFEHFELGKDVVLYSTYSNGQVFRCLKDLY